MQLRTALQQGLELLREGQVSAPELTAGVLLCHALRRERVYLYSHPEYELRDVEWLHYGRYLHERLKGKPTQYITHVQEFWGRDFQVEPGVLIPRPETEHVVEQALAGLRAWGGSPEPSRASRPRSGKVRDEEQACGASDIRRSGEGPGLRGGADLSLRTGFNRSTSPDNAGGTEVPRRLKSAPPSGLTSFIPMGGPQGHPDSLTINAPIRILDVGTGSGILAITLALETGGEICATDVSSKALTIASANAAKLGATCHFTQCDLGSAFADASFDLIVSNPPYVESAEIDTLQREVRDWEPREALDGGMSGLDIYARLIPEAARLLRPGGWLILEIGAAQGATVPASFDGSWQTPEVINDLAGLPRVVRARVIST